MVGGSIRDSGGIKGYIREFKNIFSLETESKGISTTRNFYAGLSTILIGIDSSVEGPIVEEALMKIMDVISIYGFVVMEQARRRNTTNATNQAFGSNVALEK